MAAAEEAHDVVQHPKPTAPSTMQRWFPIGEWLPRYSWGSSFLPDLIAAISVAAILIPESLGYASVAGLPVQIGLYAAPLALIAYAAFGGSKVLMVAAAGSVAAVTANATGLLSDGDQDTAIVIAAALAITTGVIFIVAGVARMGWVSNFVSKAIMGGFILGMSIQIIIGQLGNLTGVELEDGNSFEKLGSWLSQIGDWQAASVVFGVGSVILILALKRFLPVVPAALTAVVVASVLVALFDPDLSLVAEIPSGLPSVSFPSGLDLETWGTLLLVGGVVALVGFSEAWGAANNYAEQYGDDLDANQEFRAIGAANIGAGVLGGMPVTGSLSKTATAASSGGKTQMAAILLAGIVLLTLAFFAPLFQWLPEAVLAAVVITAMIPSADPRRVYWLWKLDRIDLAFAIITAIAVLAFDLLPAMLLGIVFSVGYLVYRVSFPARAVLGQDPKTGGYVATKWVYGSRHGDARPDAVMDERVIVYRFSSPLIFSNAEAFVDTGKELLIRASADGPVPNGLVVDFEEVFLVDATGATSIVTLIRYAESFGVSVALARVHAHARLRLELLDMLDDVGEERLYPTVREAVAAVTPASDETAPSSAGDD